MKAINLHTQTMVQKDRDQLWNFYISNNSVFYKIIENDVPIRNVKLIDNVKNYDVTLDLDRNVHLVCVRNNEELCYLYHSKDSWKKRVFKESSSKSCIDFINIKNINKTIHIFYSYKNNTNKEMYKIFHLYTSDEKWKYAYLGSTIMSKNIRIYFIDYSEKGNLIIIYQSQTRNKSKIYARIFDHNNYTWSVKKELKFKKDSITIKNLFIDSENNLHYIYVDNRRVSYLKDNFNNFKNLLETYNLSNSITLGDNVNEDYVIFEINNMLWICWKIKDTLYYTYSEDFGESWCEKEKFESNDIFSIKYFSCNYTDMKILKSLTTFGINRNNKLYLLGSDVDFFDTQEPKNNISLDGIEMTEEDCDDEIIDAIAEDIDENEMVKEITYEEFQSEECEDKDTAEQEKSTRNMRELQQTEPSTQKSLFKKIKSFFTLD